MNAKALYKTKEKEFEELTANLPDVESMLNRKAIIFSACIIAEVISNRLEEGLKIREIEGEEIK